MAPVLSGLSFPWVALVPLADMGKKRLPLDLGAPSRLRCHEIFELLPTVSCEPEGHGSLRKI